MLAVKSWVCFWSWVLCHPAAGQASLLVLTRRPFNFHSSLYQITVNHSAFMYLYPEQSMGHSNSPNYSPYNYNLPLEITAAYSVFCWRTPKAEELGRLLVHRSHKKIKDND